MTQARRELFDAWRDLVNLPAAEHEAFLEVFGGTAGLSRAEARAQGIASGRDSAAWIRSMRAALTRRSYAEAERQWTPAMWAWAQRQVAFNRRMRGQRGALYRTDAAGDVHPTRKLLALLLWGHDPERYETGRRGKLMAAILRRK